MRVVCLGAGYFSQFHLDGWRRIEGVELAGISNRDRAKAEATGVPVYDNLAGMLDQVQPDILDIITSPEGHADAIRLAIQHNLRAIICQKPFCRSIEEAKDMIALADEAGIPLLVHENFRFMPWYRVIKEQIEKGVIGTPLQATFRLRPGDGQGPEAYLSRQPYFQKMPRFLIHETGVHWVDTFRFLFGNPQAVYADLRQVNPVIAGEDAGYVLFDHPGDVRAVLDGNRCLDHAAQNTRCTMGEGLFEGTEGTLTLYGDGSVHRRSFASPEEVCVLERDVSGTFGGDCTYHLEAHVVSALRGERPFENLAADYLTVLHVEDAIYRSAKTHSKIHLGA